MDVQNIHNEFHNIYGNLSSILKTVCVFSDNLETILLYILQP